MSHVEPMQLSCSSSRTLAKSTSRLTVTCVVEMLPLIPNRRLKSAPLLFQIGDRKNLTAWVNGDNLVNAVASVHPNTIVVVNSVGPLNVEPWIDNPNVTAVSSPTLLIFLCEYTTLTTNSRAL